jgi:hypothetical protein
LNSSCIGFCLPRHEDLDNFLDCPIKVIVAYLITIPVSRFQLFPRRSQPSLDSRS